MSKIQQILESRIFDAGGKYEEGSVAAANQILEGLSVRKASRTIQSEEISIRDLFDSFVVSKLRAEGKDIGPILNGHSTAIAEAIVTSQFPRLISRMSEVTILDNYELALEGVDELVTPVENVKNDWAYFSRITGQDLPELTYEAMAYEETILGEYEVAIKLRKYGRVLKLTKEMILADQTGKLQEQCRNFGGGMGYHRQTEILESACTRISTKHEGVAADNLRINGTSYAVYANSHAAYPGSGGEANDNILVTNALGAAGVAAAVLQLRKVKDIHGQGIMIRPTHVIVAPDQEAIGKKLYVFAVEPNLTTTTGGYIDPNLFKGLYKPMVDLGGTDGTWYIGEFRKEIRYCWGWKPLIDAIVPQEQALTHDVALLIRCSYKGGCGHVDHRFVLKSSA